MIRPSRLHLLLALFPLYGCAGKAVERTPSGGAGTTSVGGAGGSAGNASAGASGKAAAGGGGGTGPGASGMPCSPEGASAKTADGCNDCSCSQGAWACTHHTCVAEVCGARAGNTCSDQEYCSYMPGQLCGAADATATCLPRPDGCPELYLPVCGCDSKTYSSQCDAASHGMGVNTLGVCP